MSMDFNEVNNFFLLSFIWRKRYKSLINLVLIALLNDANLPVTFDDIINNLKLQRKSSYEGISRVLSFTSIYSNYNAYC